MNTVPARLGQTGEHVSHVRMKEAVKDAVKRHCMSIQSSRGIVC